ncbi:hypothetical protein ABIA38_003402 [Embleya sp. AB8]
MPDTHALPVNRRSTCRAGSVDAHGGDALVEGRPIPIRRAGDQFAELVCGRLGFVPPVARSGSGSARCRGGARGWQGHDGSRTSVPGTVVAVTSWSFGRRPEGRSPCVPRRFVRRGTGSVRRIVGTDRRTTGEHGRGVGRRAPGPDRLRPGRGRGSPAKASDAVVGTAAVVGILREGGQGRAQGRRAVHAHRTRPCRGGGRDLPAQRGGTRTGGPPPPGSVRTRHRPERRLGCPSRTRPPAGIVRRDPEGDRRPRPHAPDRAVRGSLAWWQATEQDLAAYREFRCSSPLNPKRIGGAKQNREAAAFTLLYRWGKVDPLPIDAGRREDRAANARQRNVGG